MKLDREWLTAGIPEEAVCTAREAEGSDRLARRTRIVLVRHGTALDVTILWLVRTDECIRHGCVPRVERIHHVLAVRAHDQCPPEPCVSDYWWGGAEKLRPE